MVRSFSFDFVPTVGTHFSPDIFSPFYLAAEDEGRTEEPSDLKKQREREKGRVAQSPEIPASLVTVGILVMLFALSGYLLSGFSRIMRIYLGNFSSLPGLEDGGLMNLMVTIVREMAYLVAPVFIIAVVLGIAGNILQVGLLFSLKPIAFDFSKISLTFDKLMKRVVFSRQVIVNLLKSVAKFIFLGVVAYVLISGDVGTLLKTTSMSIPETLKLLGYLGFKLAIILSVLLLLIAIPDYFYQRYEYIESLKMTVAEVKQEFKEQEGDPQIKGEQRKLMQQLASQRGTAEAVASSSVVITNPVHYAVALAYQPGKHVAPVVTAKGLDSLAIYIRMTAVRENVPVIENRPLARELYPMVEVGKEIPYEFYAAVAGILSQLDSVRGSNVRSTTNA
ncbi:MAG: EscU/YscU/HrcU family type III secretion system export apparatus switch protein [Leptospiraceae bacterium]|nr:EscU/YscU/HrcU family type III secretion system export apparatus switch protein [Leptospiraceae bacterium]